MLATTSNSGISLHCPFSKYVDDPERIIRDFSAEDTSLYSKKTKTQKTLAVTTSSMKDLEDFINGAPHNKEHVKEAIRCNYIPLGSPLRPALWNRLTDLISKPFSRNEIYLAALRNVFGEEAVYRGVAEIKTHSLPPFSDKRFHNHRYLSHAGVDALHRILMVISFERPDITYCPILFSFMAALLHYMSEEECYACATAVLAQKIPLYYLTQTKKSYHVLSFIIQMIAKKYCKSAYSSLETLNKGNMESVFEHWIFWIFNHLPFYHLVRTIDCFLSEGPKVLYRIGLSVVDLFHKACNEGGRKSISMLSIEDFCSSITFSPGLLLKVAFGYRDLSKTGIKKLELKAEALTFSTKKKDKRVSISSSVEFLVTTNTESRIMTRNEHLLDVKGYRARQRHHSQGDECMYLFANLDSRLECDQWKQIYNWLPPRIALLSPILIFSTMEDGSSFRTFYSKIENYEQTLLIIFTSYGDLIGSYIAGRWIERKQTSGKGNKYFGTGESFVFRLTPTPAVMYGWVGLDTTSLSSVSEDPDSEERRRMRRANLFATGDDNMIAIGGGLKGQALYIHEDMTQVSSSPSDTFTNPCLLTRGDVHPISTLEVFGFVSEF